MTTLALDVGNSALKGALVTGGVVVAPFRLAHEDAAPGALEMLLRALPTRPDRARLVSVVPQKNADVAAAVTAALGQPLEIVHAGSRWPFTIGYATPQTLGLDRPAACAGAYRAGHALVVVDAGTALTLDVVTADGVYLGGAIAPGPRLLVQSLARGTAQLPDVPLERPASPIGRSTLEGLQSGVMGLFVEGTRGLLRTTLEALNTPADVVATGGWSALLAEAIPEIEAVRPHLVLEGVARLKAS